MNHSTPSRELEALLSLPEAQAVLGISKPLIFRLIREGELPVVEVCGRTLVDPADLRRFIAARRRRRCPKVAAGEPEP